MEGIKDWITEIMAWTERTSTMITTPNGEVRPCVKFKNSDNVNNFAFTFLHIDRYIHAKENATEGRIKK